MATNKVRGSGSVELPGSVDRDIENLQEPTAETKTQLLVKLFPEEIRLALEAVGSHRGILAGELENAETNLVRAREGLAGSAERHQVRAASLKRSIARFDALVQVLAMYASPES